MSKAGIEHIQNSKSISLQKGYRYLEYQYRGVLLYLS